MDVEDSSSLLGPGNSQFMGGVPGRLKKAEVQKWVIKDLLAFCTNLAEALMSVPNREASSSYKKMSPKTKVAKLPAPDKRLDGYEHWAVVDQLVNARLYRKKGCASRTQCEKCDMYLCLTSKSNCFEVFHTEQQ